MASGLIMEESPISAYLARQQRLDTPVARYAKEHVNGSACSVDASLNGHYRSMIPLTAPRKGEQYAFEVDLDACSGCKACVSACHSLNGLEDGETWRDVGLITTSNDGHGDSYQQTITTACHHCEDPACANGCPVLAYEKDPVTGIVRHLDDQCIGCQYCVLKCPYDVPKYSERLGIVRKCDMCQGRLAEGEAPACVQACPTHSIRIVTVPVAPEVPAVEANPDFHSAFPEPQYTRPTTRYISVKGAPASARAADEEVLRPQHGHAPLVWMLTLTQLSVGIFAGAAVIEQRIPALIIGFIVLMAGLGASVLHLGRPLGAWRAFLGLRKSWLSREIVVFGALPPLASAAILGPMISLPPWINGGAHAGLVMVGLVGVFCSAMIYVDTQRNFWRPFRSFPRFFGTAMVAAAFTLAAGESSAITAAIATLAFGALLLWDRFGLRQDFGSSILSRRQSARIQAELLPNWVSGRYLAGAIAVACALVSTFLGPVPAMVGAVVMAGSELCSRLLYFKAVDAPKMPGGLTS
ncbi:MAG: DmsC/YnfH family molybdoenzyme membrane anchor subunit [Opitutales bacterium]